MNLMKFFTKPWFGGNSKNINTSSYSTFGIQSDDILNINGINYKICNGVVNYAMTVVFNPPKNHVLLLQKKRGPKFLINTWIPPGGKLNINETALNAAIRELIEETAITPELCSEFKKVCEFNEFEKFNTSVYTVTMQDYFIPIAEKIEGLEQEPLKWIPLEQIFDTQITNINSQTRWLVAMALDESIIGGNISLHYE